MGGGIEMGRIGSSHAEALEDDVGPDFSPVPWTMVMGLMNAE